MDTSKERKYIEMYYGDMGCNVVFPDSLPEVISMFASARRNSIVISDNKWMRGMAKLLGMPRHQESNLSKISAQYFAWKDALLLLARKNVPIYFYNRVGQEKNGFVYTKSAQRRMKLDLSFPLMYDDIEKYEEDFKELFGDKYSKDYVKAIGKIPQVVRKGNEYCHEDYSSKLINVVNGKRRTCYQPTVYTRTIHIYGRCGAFGYAVEDADTFPSRLQKELKERGYGDILVVNHGLWGGIDEYVDHNFLNETVAMKEGDIVLFYRKHFDKRIIEILEERGMWYKEITHEYHQYPAADHCFYNRPGHMNYEGYQIVGKLVADDLISHEFKCKEIKPAFFDGFKADNLNTYLKNAENTQFNDEVKAYTDMILREFPLPESNYECGSIVMNCNPFTYGHRYLIEYAATRVDRLYVFVVEEDKSFFRFTDRLDMVKEGTKDIDDVVVVSSGKFIISSYTFPEYFMKDYVQEKDFDVSMDVETFCKYIAPPLHISIRFAGEEPFDPVTKNYNENMARILPIYGMKFCEVQRLSNVDGKVVNATEVRRLLKDHKFNEIKKYVPESTFKILIERY